MILAGRIWGKNGLNKKWERGEIGSYEDWERKKFYNGGRKSRRKGS